MSHQCLTLILMSFAPIIPLTIYRAVQSLLALTASLVLHSFTFWTWTEWADVEEGASLILLLRAHCLGKTALLFKPLQWCIVHPWVENWDGIPYDLLLWALLRTKSVQQIVLCLDAEHVKPGFEILGDDVDSVPGHLLFLFVALLGLLDLIVLESPKTRVAKNWTQVSLDRPHEVLMVKAQHLVNEVFDQDAHHPDLLISDSTTRSLIHSIFA